MIIVELKLCLDLNMFGTMSIDQFEINLFFVQSSSETKTLSLRKLPMTTEIRKASITR